MRRLIIGVALLASALLVAACGGGSAAAPTPTPVVVTLDAKDLAYNHEAITVQAGQPVLLKFTNSGALAHDFTVDSIPLAAGHSDDGHADSHGTSTAPDADLHFHLEPGESGEFTFTPTESSTYTFYCSVPGHKEGGMEGTLIVN